MNWFIRIGVLCVGKLTKQNHAKNGFCSSLQEFERSTDHGKLASFLSVLNVFHSAADR